MTEVSPFAKEVATAVMESLTPMIQREIAIALLQFRSQMERNPDAEMLTSDAAAKLLSVSVRTLKRYEKNGMLSGERFGGVLRYKREDVLALAKSS